MQAGEVVLAEREAPVLAEQAGLVVQPELAATVAASRWLEAEELLRWMRGCRPMVGLD